MNVRRRITRSLSPKTDLVRKFSNQAKMFLGTNACMCSLLVCLEHSCAYTVETAWEIMAELKASTLLNLYKYNVCSIGHHLFHVTVTFT